MDNCWIFADKGKTGSLKQAQALADALGFNSSVFEVELPLPWRLLPPQAGLLPINPLPLMITQPYPEYVIGIGRQSVIPTVYMKRYAKTIFIQDPKIHPRHFNWVIAPKHDHLSGSNVIQITGSLHSISPDYIAALPASPYHSVKPIVAVFIGGSSKHVTYTDDLIQTLCKQLKALYNQGYDIVLTPSRRTAPHHVEIIQQILGDIALNIWDLKSKNPYNDYLKAADYFIVTNDSISMMSELCSSGKPVYILDVGIKKHKFQEFIHHLFHIKAARPFTGDLEFFKPTVLNDMEVCLQALNKQM